MTKIGFIGTGNMGSALATAIAKNDDVCLILSNRTISKAKALAETLHAKTGTNSEASKAQFVFLGVEPNQVKQALSDLPFAKDSVLVSMVAGLSIQSIQNLVKDVPVVRIMPNTPVMIGQGMTLVSYSPDVKPEVIEQFKSLMDPSGRVIFVEEKLIDTASAVSGCGPAFVDIFIEALADGAVSLGVPRKQALEIASQMVAGSAQYVLQTQKHPEELKDNVCSPGGSTIEGVIALENGNFRASVINAVRACAEKNGKLGK